MSKTNFINNINPTVLTVIPPNNNQVTCKADTGATRTYFRPEDAHILDDVEPVLNGPRVNLPNSQIIQANLRGKVPQLKRLGNDASEAHVFEHLKNALLVSIGQLCDQDCIAVFDKQKLHIFRHGELVLDGVRNHVDGLWDIVFNPTLKNPPVIQHANVIVRADQTKTNLAEYFHKCLFSPPLVTIQMAVRLGHLSTWPGIRKLNFLKLIYDTIPTAKGHLNQERKNLRSTKPNVTPYISTTTNNQAGTLSNNVPTPNPTVNEYENDYYQEDYYPTEQAGVRTYKYASMVVPFRSLQNPTQTLRDDFRTNRLGATSISWYYMITIPTRYLRNP